MRLLTFFAAFVFVAVLGYALFARSGGVEAGTAIRMDVPDLVGGSELVLEGSILGANPVVFEGRIETEYLIQVDRTFAGVDEPYRSVRVPGGVLPDGSGMVLAGMPRIDAGENVLLFLSEEGSTGIRVPVGLAQGKFTVVEHPGGERTLVRDSSGVSLVNEEGRLLHGEGSEVFAYAQIVAEIEAALAAKKAR